MENVKLPFKEEQVSENVFIRTFYQDVDSGELHRDREDRIIEPVEKTDCKFQIDNELLFTIECRILIPKGVYHRLIKGTGDLKIKLEN